MTRPWRVAKVGGSLLDWPGLPGAMAGWRQCEPCASGHVAYLPGGGGAADWIRRLDRAHRLPAATSHALAIRAMGLNAWVLAHLLKGRPIVDGQAWPEVEKVAGGGSEPLSVVVDPTNLIGEMAGTLPESWEVTSDSIGAWLARRMGATLTLLKSASLPSPEVDLKTAARRGLVDPEFPRVARPLGSVEWINLRRGERGWLVAESR